MKKLTYLIVTLTIMLGFAGCGNPKPYPQTVNSWKSYKDVANYMQGNFRFDTNRQNEFRKEFVKYKRKTGDMSDYTIDIHSKTALETYNSGSGFCGDSATLIKDALNKVNPTYNSKIIFIFNNQGPPHHWVNGFYVDGKLHVMDYGTGSHWSAMMGIHGPYNSLDEYVGFLKSIHAKNFEFGWVQWRD